MIANKLKELRKSRGLTLDEVAEAVGTSKQTIHRYENGVITNVPPEKVELLARALGASPALLMGWDEDGARGTAPLYGKRLPFLGEIACGEPRYAAEEHEGFIATDGGLDADFCLRAKGDSMTGARIFDGDIVFIKAQSAVDNGEIAAVIINDEATLKRVYYYPAEKKLMLMPENPSFAPLLYVDDELAAVKILGKAIAFQSTVR